LNRAFAILRALADHAGTSGLAEIVDATALPKSTTSRMLTALVSLGMVEKVGGRYSIGTGVITLGRGATPVGSLPEMVRPHLAGLADELGENASLAVEDADTVLYVDTVVSPGAVQVRDWTGERVPIHTAAAGITLMTSWTDDRVRRLAEAGLEALTASTVTSASELRRKISSARRAGIAWTLSEFSDEVNGVAAPIFDPEGRAIAAITVYGPTYRFPAPGDSSRIEVLITDACKRAAASIHRFPAASTGA